MRYSGKKAVVVGGTHGMGRAMVEALRDGGADVLFTGRTARTDLGDLGDRMVAVDVTRMADVDALGRAVAAELGQVDALFVNQGYAKLAPYDEVTEEVYDRHFDVNAKGAFFAVRRLAPLIRDGGAIVFTSSVADSGGAAGMIAYGASKAALWSFAQGFAAELLPRGIRVNALSPGFISTPTMGVDAPDELRAEFTAIGDEMTPMKRHGTVAEVAAAALFLAFDATFTTGVKLAVDGGLGQRIA